MSKATDTKQKRLVLLDTHAILHRAYHALPELASSKGEPTGALYGLVSTILKLAQELKPDYLIATRDLPGKTHRHDKFEAYKATRMAADPALIAQLKRAPIVYEAFGIPLYAAPGFEADDMIGSIVQALKKRDDIRTIIATGDMDTLQLVSPKVLVYTMRKGISDTVLYDEGAVNERYGFGPERVIDYKALRGDPSDNIPGVRGIGEKTATELIQAFGSLDEIYAVLASNEAAFQKAGIKPRIVQLLKDQKEQAYLSKDLATIHTEAPIVFAVPDTTWRMGDHGEAVGELCENLEFRTLKNRVHAASGMTGEPQASEEKIDQRDLRETSIALWLLRSDTSNPTLDDVLRAGASEQFAAAREKVFAQLRETPNLLGVYEKIEKPLIPVVERMNAAGVFLDVPRIRSLGKEYSMRLETLSRGVYRAAGHEFNINSPKQLAEVLYDELHIGSSVRQKKTASGARTTREEELVKFSNEHPIIDEVLSYRELQKLLGTYIEKLPALVDSASRLHAEFVQAGTTTGRMSSQNPNLQNIPVATENGRRIREAFAAPVGRCIAALDYSQIELRIAAGLSGDKKLIEVFMNGEDVHAAVASEVFGVPREQVDKEMRRRAKVINFGILYGMGVNALKENLGSGVSREEASAYLDQYFKKYAGLAQYVEDTKLSAAKCGYTETLFGRRRYFAALQSPLPQMRAAAERMAVNAPIQGTQADIIKLAMVKADHVIEKNEWRANAQLVMQVHDELVYEVDEKYAEEISRAICHSMESVVDQKALSGVPITAEISIGPNWGQTKKITRV